MKESSKINGAMNKRNKYKLVIISCLILFIAVILNEYLLYYFVQYKCNWPQLSANDSHNDPVKALIITDTHLLGSKSSPWFDMVLRDWQMTRAFQTAISLHKPEIVFVLGDLLNEGLWSNDKELKEYYERFSKIFEIPKATTMLVVAGNHDIGFHYEITKKREKTFSSIFDADPVKLITIKNVHFVLINSMGMDMDNCFLCNKTEQFLEEISETMKCWNKTGDCTNVENYEKYSKPILVQHFPLYRLNEELCFEWDSATGSDRTDIMKEEYDCLSKNASIYLYNTLSFREAWSGHTHYGCIYNHHFDAEVKEYTVASFNYRNRNDPNYILAYFTPENTYIYKCAMPTQATFICLYVIAALLICFCLYKFFNIKCCQKIKRLYLRKNIERHMEIL